MNYKQLESFRLGDAIKFHDKLNPNIWLGNRLRPEVKKQLKKIAEDFTEELGISGLDVVDLTVSGSNAAYSYTPHSDLDLHILVNMRDLPNNDVYKELFNAKKNIYNDSHNIKIYGIPVELYVQDANEPVVSLGEFSILQDKWLKLPSKRRANFDQTATKARNAMGPLPDGVAGALNKVKELNQETYTESVAPERVVFPDGLKNLALFGRITEDYKIGEYTFKISTLSNRQQKELVKKLFKLDFQLFD